MAINHLYFVCSRNFANIIQYIQHLVGGKIERNDVNAMFDQERFEIERIK
jgi:hypothetical protein